MGAQPLTNIFFYPLEIIHSKKKATEQKKRINYYPFGLEHKGYNNIVNPSGNSVAQKFGFGGKELSKERGINWHDFGARNYDASIGRWMNIDPLASKMPEWSPYIYALNNPVNFIDPDGKAPINPKDAIKLLNNIVSSVESSLNKAWKDSFNNNKSVVNEHGFAVFKGKEKSRSRFYNSKDKNIIAKNFKKGQSGSVQFDYKDFKGEKGEKFLALVHTHPYSTGEEKDAGGISLLGASFSGGDISNMRNYGEGNAQIVEAGTKRFAMVVTDAKKSNEFFKNNSRSTINKNIKSAIGAFMKAGQSFSEATINANKSVLKNSGISFYGTSDKSKKNFKLLQ